MDNLRNITYRIKSCVACNEEQCPVIRERLDHHVISHHSTIRSSASNQHIKPSHKHSGIFTSSRSNASIINSDEQTSTSDLSIRHLNETLINASYVETLRAEVLEWADNLPKYASSSTENLKLNLLNKLIQKINTLSTDVNEGFYDLKLSVEITKFFDSLPDYTNGWELESVADQLKENLIHKIHKLNKNIINNQNYNNCLQDQVQNGNPPKLINSSTNTTDPYNNHLNITNNVTKISSDEKSGSGIKEQNYSKKKFIDAQVQHSLSDLPPYYGAIYGQPKLKITKPQKVISKEECFKQKIFEWLSQVMQKHNRNIDLSDKKVLTDVMYNRLRSLLSKKYNSSKCKILLKGEILNFLYDYFSITVTSNSLYYNKLVENLAITLMIEKTNSKTFSFTRNNTMYAYEYADQVIRYNIEPDYYLKPIFYKIICDTLENVSINSDSVENDITDLLLHNISYIIEGSYQEIERDLSILLKSSSDLCDHVIVEIVRSILTQSSNVYRRYMGYTEVKYNEKHAWRRAISIYRSESKLQNYILKLSTEPKLTATERIHMDQVNSLQQFAATSINRFQTNQSNQKEICHYNEENLSPLESYKLDYLKYIEDRIFILIDSQPDKIFDNSKKNIMKQLVHEFTWCTHKYIYSNMSWNEVNECTIAMLKRIIKPREIHKFNSLKEQLLNILKDLKQKFILDDHESIIHLTECKRNKTINPHYCLQHNTEGETIFKEFIFIYIKHISEVENPTARAAFAQLFKMKLQTLNTYTKSIDCENFVNNVENNVSTPESLERELKYINLISDWLKAIPLNISFNKVGNRSRIDFVISLARSISEAEKEVPPSGIDRYVYLEVILNRYSEKLPLPSQLKKNICIIIQDLIKNVLALCSTQKYYVNNDISSTNSTNIPEVQLNGFIAEYICINCEELSRDELKLEALTMRLCKEFNLNELVAANSRQLKEYGRLNEENVLAKELIRQFSFELGYAKEITNWLHNLPLISPKNRSCYDLKVKMISNLAEKMLEKRPSQIDSSNAEVDEDIKDYIIQWISELPLDLNKDIDRSIATKQILSRLKKASKAKQPESRATPMIFQCQAFGNICRFPHECCKNTLSNNQSQPDPSIAIVEAIENWCTNLPLLTETQNKDTIKADVAAKLYQKLSELNMKPECFTNNNLYQELFSEEIDLQIHNLQKKLQPQYNKGHLKELLVSSIMENRIKIREKASSMEYKYDLEKTIELSIPNPVQTYQEETPGFKIYKDRLASLFILENFDHGFNTFKKNYEKRIKKEIDRYFQDVLERNVLKLTKDEIYNELYSSLFSVPLPNNASIANEVEEIKTRCEIDDWFETLPITTSTGISEVLEREQILAMLAKRLSAIERFENHPDIKMHKEITKWLLKFPILRSQKIKVNDFAQSLVEKLKSTIEQRKCIQFNGEISLEQVAENENKNIEISGNAALPPLLTCCQKRLSRPVNPADIIFNTVKEWCQQLPLLENAMKEDINIIKENLVIKICMKICELNMNSETLQDDFLYDALLDDELDHLMDNFPKTFEFIQTQNNRKIQLKNALNSIKYLIKKEKIKFDYKQELINVVSNILKEPEIKSTKTKALYLKIKEDIVDWFILYNNYTDDEKYIYKIMMYRAINKYLRQLNSNDVLQPNPLMTGNQLFCEMTKVPLPSDAAIVEEVQEIRIKLIITDFFNEENFCNNEENIILKTQIIPVLTKRLCDLVKAGVSQENYRKINTEIIKRFKKINLDIDPEKVDLLIQKLNHLVNTAPLHDISCNGTNNTLCDGMNKRCSHQRFDTYRNSSELGISNKQHVDDEQWRSFLSVTRKHNGPENVYIIKTKDINKINNNPRELQNLQLDIINNECNINESDMDYCHFKHSAATTLTPKKM